MKISEFYTYAPKSRIKAGDANPNGKYQFYASSPDENRRCDEYLYDCKAIVMGTGGSATIHYYDGKFSTSTDCLVLVPNEKIKAKYLYYFFLGNMSTLEAGFKGAGLKHTNKGYIDSIEIAKIPPLSKQGEIIELFDKLISRIKKQQSQIEKLDELVKARFVEMFSDETRWTKSTIGECCKLKSGTSLSSSKENEGGPIPYVKVGDMNLPGNEKYITTSSRFVTEATANKGLFEIGSIIFPKRGGAIGTNKKRMTKVPICADLNVMGVSSKGQLLPEYLFVYFEMIDLASLSDGSSVPQINNKNIAPLEVSIPPIALQTQFAAFVTQVDKSKFAVQKSLEKTQLLFNSLMQDYFG